MKILHVLHNSLPLLCGYSIRSGYIVNLQRAMGLDPAVVTSGQHPNGDSMLETIEGIDYRRTPAHEKGLIPFSREWQLIRSLEREVDSAARDFKPDIIHAHSPVLVGLPALRVARRIGVPVVYEIRDLWENASVDRGRFGAGSPLYRVARGFESHVVRNADAVVTICDLLKNELKPRARTPEHVHVIANGVDSDAFRPESPHEDVRQKFGLTGKELILYAGTFQPYEGLDLLVRAIREIVRHRPQAHLVIVGGSAGLAGGGGTSSPEERALRALVDELAVGSHVTFTGRVPHSEVKGLYSIADVVAYPRVLTLTTALTTPLKPLEAMAMARAVIVSDVPPMKELVQDRTTGLLFKSGDYQDLAARCLELLSNPVLRSELGNTARDWVVRERHWPILIGGYRSIYESVLGRATRHDERVPA